MYIFGIDIGQAGDYTAFAVIEVKSETEFHLTHLERLELGTSYPAQIARMASLYKTLKELGETHMVVDGTGVGRAVVDALVEYGLSFTAIHITGGSAISSDGLYLRVPKRDLVMVTALLLQNKHLKLAPSLSLAPTLTKELLAFKVSFNARGHDSYGNDTLSWREADHDDLVLATALACWEGRRRLFKPRKYYSTIKQGKWRLPSQIKDRR